MAVKEFIGARYITKFANPIQWDSTRAYEAIEAVQHNGFTYVSKQPVPVGIEITNTDFWLLWADPNAQMEQLRQIVEEYQETVEGFDNRITEAENKVNTNEENIDRNKIISCLQELDFAPYTRYIFENVNEEWLGAQVSTMDEDENYFYVVTPYNGDNTQTTKRSYIRVIDPQSGTMLNGIQMDVGHGRSLTVKNNIMLTSNQYGEDNNEWIAIDITNKTLPTEMSRGTFNGRHIFWTDEGAACYTGNNTIKFFDVTYDSFGAPESFVENGESIQFTRGIKGEEQSFQYWNGFIIMSSTAPETISIFDAKTGETIAQNLLRDHYSYLNTSECESAFIINGHMYFSNTGLAPTLPNLEKQIECSFFRCDFMSPKGEFYDYWRLSEYQKNKSVNLNVSGNKPTLSSVSADGSTDFPFWFVEDCIYSYDNMYRMRYNHIKPELGLSVAFTQSNYPYIINVRNIRDYTINLNGYGAGNITEVPFIHAYNAMLTANRLKILGIVNTDLTTLSHKVGIYARRSDVIIQNCEFEENTEEDFDVYEIDASVKAKQKLNHVRANGGFIIAQEFTETPVLSNGGIAQTYGLVSPLSGNSLVNFSSAGNPATQTNWINFLRVDGKLFRVFFAPTEIEYRYYPNYNNLSEYTTLWRINTGS